MKTVLLLIFCSLYFVLSAQEKEMKQREAFELIEAWLEAQKDYEELPAISASVLERQKELWSGSYGFSNVEDQIQAKTNTIYSICSISKLFTAVAIMKLYDEGKLRLDDHIEDILPWYDLKQQYIESGPITIRSLLTHSSGLPRENIFDHWNGPDYPTASIEEIKESLSEQETLYPASTYYQYSNLALTLLGEVVTQVSGMPYKDYVQSHIIEPLGLSDTRTYLPRDIHGGAFAIGYSSKTRAGDKVRINFYDMGGVAAAAGFSSNVHDLGKFASWQYRLIDSSETEILRPSTLRNMHNVHWTDADWGSTWGLGFSVSKADDGSKWVSHGGHCPGYKTTLQLHPKSGMAYVVMINTSGGNPVKYVRGMHGILNKYNSTDSLHTTLDLDLNEYTGFYDWSNLGEAFLTPWKGYLARIYLPSGNPANSISLFKPVGRDRFQRVRDDQTLGEDMIFTRDENENIIEYRIYNYLYRRL
jgi:CubicO group peptidase (beta-lactamase class C family)